MSSPKGKGGADSRQESQQPRTTDSSSLIVEPDVDSNTSTTHPIIGASPKIFESPDREDLEIKDWERSPASPTRNRRDYYLRGLAIQDVTDSTQEPAHDASRSSATAIQASQSQSSSAEMPADRPQAIPLEEHVGDSVMNENKLAEEDSFGNGDIVSMPEASRRAEQSKHIKKAGE